MKLYRVFEADDFGKPTKYWGVFRATDTNEARDLASRYYNNPEIITTGFYSAREVTQGDLAADLNEYTMKTKILN